jgi:hypothetical protein
LDIIALYLTVVNAEWAGKFWCTEEQNVVDLRRIKTAKLLKRIGIYAHQMPIFIDDSIQLDKWHYQGRLRESWQSFARGCHALELRPEGQKRADNNSRTGASEWGALLGRR